jgi:carboxypeptidase T
VIRRTLVALGMALGCCVGLLPAVGAPAALAASDFPPGYEGYHTYAEMVADINNVVAQYGQGPGAIVEKFSIGKTYEGRKIWVVKISDNVNTDENEPEILSESLIHAREHITPEMNLYLIHLLTDNYGKDTALGQRVTDIVNSREIWIIPMVNPDGGEYDISGGTFHGWRKNRQVVVPGYVGIDLNRNWGFQWGCCGGSSGKPSSARYRGQYPFQAPEDIALRDFILSRRIDGVQQIKILLNWHSYGEHLLWPYGYTRTDVPPTMSADDHAAEVALATQMAAMNGYKAEQGSSMYIYDGDITAWTYGDQRIISFTFEMYPKWGCKCGGFHPPDTVIAAQTERNREAVLYALEQAACPYAAAGLGARDCGPLYDDFETDRGWTVNPGGTDTATTGAWERAIPEFTRDADGAKQRANTPSGQAALVTGAAAGASVDANSVDGRTSILSPVIDLGAGSWELKFRFTFAHNALSDASDYLRVSVVDGATVTPLWTAQGNAANRNARWRTRKVYLTPWAGKTVQLLIEANGTAGHTVEAEIDDVRVFQAP